MNADGTFDSDPVKPGPDFLSHLGADQRAQFDQDLPPIEPEPEQHRVEVRALVDKETGSVTVTIKDLDPTHISAWFTPKFVPVVEAIVWGTAEAGAVLQAQDNETGSAEITINEGEQQGDED